MAELETDVPADGNSAGLYPLLFEARLNKRRGAVKLEKSIQCPGDNKRDLQDDESCKSLEF